MCKYIYIYTYRDVYKYIYIYIVGRRDELVVYLSFSCHSIYVALLLCIEHCFTKVKILHYIYIYIYMYVCMYVCMYVYIHRCSNHLKFSITYAKQISFVESEKDELIDK